MNIIVPIFLYSAEDGVYYEDCTEEEWLKALESGEFESAWVQVCETQKLSLSNEIQRMMRFGY